MLTFCFNDPFTATKGEKEKETHKEAEAIAWTEYVNNNNEAIPTRYIKYSCLPFMGAITEKKEEEERLRREEEERRIAEEKERERRELEERLRKEEERCVCVMDTLYLNSKIPWL